MSADLSEYYARQPTDPMVTAGALIGFAVSAGIALDGAAEQAGMDLLRAQAAVDAYIDWLQVAVGSAPRPRARRSLPPGWALIRGGRN